MNDLSEVYPFNGTIRLMGSDGQIYESPQMPQEITWEFVGPLPDEFQDCDLSRLDCEAIGSFTWHIDEIDADLEALMTGRIVWTWRSVFKDALRLDAFLEYERTHWWELPVQWERKQHERP